MAKEAKERQGARNDLDKNLVSNLKQSQKKTEPRTADKIAEKVGVSRNTYNALVRLYKPRRPFLAPWTGKYAINVLERLEQPTEPDINISS